MRRILSYGSLNLDHVYRVPHFVAPGETLAAGAYQLNCGGKGLNQSIAAARAGASVFHAGKVGAGGQLLTALLEESGVDTSLVVRTQEPDGHAIIQVEQNGQNCILIYGGSNRCITAEEIDAALSAFGSGDLLILQNEINGLRELMTGAAARGMFVIFNPSPIDDALLTLPLETVSLLVFNEVEGAALSGCTAPEDILDTLRRRFPACRLLLTLGGDGSLYDDGTRRIAQPIYPVPTVDTTAAGDTFTGYFAALLAEGRSAEECLELASRAAAIAVSRPGAAVSIPTMAEVLASL